MHLYTYILCLRVRCICGCVTFLKSRMSYEKLHDCEGTFNTRCEGAKAQASNRSSIPLGSSASAKSNPGRRLCCRPNNSSKPPENTAANMALDFAATYKVLVLGDSNVGKTCIVHRYCDERYYDTYISTIGEISFASNLVINHLPGFTDHLQVARVVTQVVSAGSLLDDRRDTFKSKSLTAFSWNK